MRPTLALTLLLILPILAPPAEAGWFSDVEIRVAPYRAGDLLRYEVVSESDAPDGARGRSNETFVAHVEGPSRVQDAYGAWRDAIAVRLDVLDATGLLSAFRCHLDARSGEGLRSDVLTREGGGGSTGWSGSLLATSTTRYARNQTASFGPACEGELFQPRHALLREGETMDVHDVVPSDMLARARSSPAEAATFEGRPALVFTWDVRALVAPQVEGRPADVGGSLAMVFAEGLPGVAEMRVDVVAVEGGNRSAMRATYRLAGHHAGDGPEVPFPDGTRLPPRNPDARFEPWSRLAPETAAFRLAYPLEQALEDLRAQEPRFQAFLDAHPDAFLHDASYQAGAPSGDPVEPTRRVGSWHLVFSSGRGTASYLVARDEVAPNPLLALPAATQQASVLSPDEIAVSLQAPPTKGAEVADDGSLAALAAKAGVPPGEIRRLRYLVLTGGDGKPQVTWEASVLGPGRGDAPQRGPAIAMRGDTGGLSALYEERAETREEGILSTAAAPDLPRGGASTLSALVGPGAGVGLAGGAAAGVAILLLLVKFLLVPLFTRLRRDRLLDNPVRARLYERVRAEPGIHLAELIDFGGVGEGATRHHLDQLARHRLVVRLADAGFTRFYAAGEVPPDVARREGILRAGSLRAVYDLYAAQPDVPLREAGRRLGLAAPTVHRAKRKLEDAGLLPAAREADVAAVAP